MSDTIIVALIVAIPPTLAAVAALVVSLKNHSATKEVHLSINSRLDQLVASTRSTGLLEGRNAGIIEGRKLEGDERDKGKP